MDCFCCCIFALIRFLRCFGAKGFTFFRAIRGVWVLFDVLVVGDMFGLCVVCLGIFLSVVFDTWCLVLDMFVFVGGLKLGGWGICGCQNFSELFFFVFCLLLCTCYVCIVCVWFLL